MRENIKAIKFMAFCSTILAGLTYLITLNIEIRFLSLNSSWISNNFALTICGGAFASFLVVLLCEIQKYFSNKVLCENTIFYQTMYLYIALYLMHRNIEDFLNDKNQPVPPILLDDRVHMAYGQVTALQSVDYVTFLEKNTLFAAQECFHSHELQKIGTLLNHTLYLKTAVNTVELHNLESGGRSGVVTSSDSIVAQTLMRLNQETVEELNAVDCFLATMQNHCKKRFDWDSIKRTIQSGYISVFEAGKFEDFLKDTEV